MIIGALNLKLIIVSIGVLNSLVKSQLISTRTFQQLVREAQEARRGNFVIKFPERRNNIRKQHIFSKSYPFPCVNATATGIGRSSRRPTSVHRLRPGDIDVIGAMGDSLIAGNGALEEWALGTMIEYRGVSWCAGGQGTWREYLTLPNILKEFNPNLTGYSTGTGEFLSDNSKLNVAFPVSADADALRQAKILVSKMKRDPRINFREHWKMITIFFGANDVCSAQCYNKYGSSAHMHARKLMDALDYLYKKMPRTFVNLIPVLDVSVSIRIKRTMMCRLLHTLFCACFHRGGNEMNVITQLIQQYQRAEEELLWDRFSTFLEAAYHPSHYTEIFLWACDGINLVQVYSGRYDNKDDFTVVIQPFMKLFNAPEDPAHKYDEVIDISYITHDCFHFSQKGHALGANMLWNNLLQPVGLKSQRRLNYIMQKFECPRPEAPFLFTNKNTKIYLETGHQ